MGFDAQFGLNMPFKMGVFESMQDVLYDIQITITFQGYILYYILQYQYRLKKFCRYQRVIYSSRQSMFRFTCFTLNIDADLWKTYVRQCQNRKHCLHGLSWSVILKFVSSLKLNLLRLSINEFPTEFVNFII